MRKPALGSTYPLGLGFLICKMRVMIIYLMGLWLGLNEVIYINAIFKGQEEKGVTEDEMIGRHHLRNGHEFEQALGDGEGQRSQAHCCAWGRKESDPTEQQHRNVTYSSEWIIYWMEENHDGSIKYILEALWSEVHVHFSYSRQHSLGREQ